MEQTQKLCHSVAFTQISSQAVGILTNTEILSKNKGIVVMVT